MIDTAQLEQIKKTLRVGIENYSRYPANAKAFLKPSDLVQFYIVFEHMIERVLEVARQAVACENSVRVMQATISNDRFAMQIALEQATKPTITKAEQKRRKDPKYRLDHAELSVRSYNALMQDFGKEATAYDVAGKTAQELLRTPNFGKVSLKEVEAWLAQLGLRLS